MTPAAPLREDGQADARRELERLRNQIGEAQALLARLEAEIADAQERVGRSRTLMAINEQLLLAALRAQIETENVARAGHEATAAARELAEAEYKEKYAQLSEANEQLVMAALGAQELQAAAEQAQKRQSEVLAVVAHELRHPLGPIRNAAAVLSRISDQSPVLVRMQRIIEQQVQNMARLVGDLLDATRARTGKLRIERERIDLVTILEDALQLCLPEIERRTQRLRRPELPASLMVVGDPVRLAQVFNNLLDNACKYTPSGGEIRVGVDVIDAKVVVSVSDTGIGITADALPRVFEPFVQELHATAFNGVGLGLGLTVVKELVEAHGGTVWASSEGPGLGACFFVALPLAADVSV